VLVGKENLRAKDNWDPQHWQKKHDTDSDSQMRGQTGGVGGNGQTFYAFCLIKIATGYNVVLKAATGEQQNRNRKKSTERKCYIPTFKILEKIFFQKNKLKNNMLVLIVSGNF